jgi:NAD(P)-dependent dehydrogenase (short-subunit alcohol dehydrogenase family)
MAPVWEQTLENWTWVLGVNLWGVIHGVRSFMPLMLAQGTEGHVVNTASMAGHLSMPFGSPYGVTKHAVVTLSESMHAELAAMGAPVKVSVLCPGWVRTQIADSERVRPEALKNAQPTSEGQQGFTEMVRGLVQGGIPPSAVAEQVLTAIREERFYVFPHPEMLAGVRERLENVLDARNPTFGVEQLAQLSTKG